MEWYEMDDAVREAILRREAITEPAELLRMQYLGRAERAWSRRLIEAWRLRDQAVEQELKTIIKLDDQELIDATVERWLADIAVLSAVPPCESQEDQRSSVALVYDVMRDAANDLVASYMWFLPSKADAPSGPLVELVSVWDLHRRAVDEELACLRSNDRRGAISARWRWKNLRLNFDQYRSQIRDRKPPVEQVPLKRTSASRPSSSGSNSVQGIL